MMSSLRMTVSKTTPLPFACTVLSNHLTLGAVGEVSAVVEQFLPRRMRILVERRSRGKERVMLDNVPCIFCRPCYVVDAGRPRYSIASPHEPNDQKFRCTWGSSAVRDDDRRGKGAPVTVLPNRQGFSSKRSSSRKNSAGRLAGYSRYVYLVRDNEDYRGDENGECPAQRQKLSTEWRGSRDQDVFFRVFAKQHIFDNLSW